MNEKDKRESLDEILSNDEMLDGIEELEDEDLEGVAGGWAGSDPPPPDPNSSC